MLLYVAMMQDVCDDKRQIFLCHHLLFVAQFNNAIRHTFGLLWSQFQAKFFQILYYIGLAATFAQRIFTFTSKTFWEQFIYVQATLFISISMNT